MQDATRQLTPRDIDALLAESIETSLLEEAPEDFLYTTATRTIISRLDAARRNRYPFVLVSGPAGSGKSMTVREYARDKEVGYIRCYPDFGPSELLQEIIAHLSLNETKSYRLKLSVVATALRQRYRMIALDEAQLMNRKALEAAKYLADEAGCTFVLIMTDEFVDRLRNWRDIDSRTGVAATIGPVSLDEFRVLYSDSGFGEVTLDEIHTITGGVMRDVARLIRLIDEFCEINAPRGLTRGLLAPRHVRIVAEKLNLRGGR
jgi:DNA transposition AAA+ family ATPase